MLKFNDPTMLAAARGRVTSLRWRFVIGALFAAGASFVLDSRPAGFGWYLALVHGDGVRPHAGQLLPRGARREGAPTAGGAVRLGQRFLASCIFAAMPVVLAALGGGPGRVLGVLMAASSLVSVMLFTFQAPRFMLLVGGAGDAGVAGDAVHSVRAGTGGRVARRARRRLRRCRLHGLCRRARRSTTRKMVAGWKAANQAAKERQLEAEVKRAEAEEANRAKSEFLAVMTHELRTPLNAVIGYAEIINEDLAAEGRNELADDATRITGSARHLLGLIDQILNMSSIDAGNEGLALARRRCAQADRRSGRHRAGRCARRRQSHLDARQRRRRARVHGRRQARRVAWRRSCPTR